MKMMGMVAVMVLLGALTVGGVPDSATAGHLLAPTGVVCPIATGSIEADWDDVVGATKYSVDVVAGYDTSGDGLVDTTLDFDFGTSDRTDGLPISTSSLDIALGGLDAAFDLDGDGLAETILSPLAVDLRVKALHPGKDQGRQNGAFSDFCHVLP